MPDDLKLRNLWQIEFFAQFAERFAKVDAGCIGNGQIAPHAPGTGLFKDQSRQRHTLVWHKNQYTGERFLNKVLDTLIRLAPGSVFTKKCKNCLSRLAHST